MTGLESRAKKKKQLFFVPGNYWSCLNYMDIYEKQMYLLEMTLGHALRDPKQMLNIIWLTKDGPRSIVC
jgi:hypothetical protein